MCLCVAKASHSHKIWAEVSSSAPHFLHKGLSLSSSMWRCLLKVLCPVSRPVTTLEICVITELTVIIFHGSQFFISIMTNLWHPCQTVKWRRYFIWTPLEGDICRDIFPVVLSGMINRKIISELALYINLCCVVKSNNRRTLLTRKKIFETFILDFRTQARDIPQSIVSVAGTPFLDKDRVFMIRRFFYSELKSKNNDR
jgi:hypothetical protein